MDEVRKAKDKGAQLLAKGKLEPALVEYRKALGLAPDDLATRQKVAELLGKLGRKAEAVREYQHVVGRYAATGHLLKAVALCKVILQLDPRHTETQTALAELYARHRGDDLFTAAVPAPMAAQMPKSLAKPAAPLRPDTSQRLVVVPDDELPTLEEESFEVGADDVVSVEEAEVELDISFAADDEEEVTQVEVAPGGVPRIPLFSDLSRSAFAAVAEGVDIVTYEPGQPVVREGERDQAMFAIVQGWVRVLRSVEGGAVREVARMGEGDFFGEMALLAGTPRLATVEAAEPTVLMVFTKERMDAVVQDHPSVGQALERFYRERLLANLLRSSPLFQPLSPAEREALAAEFKARTARKGEVLVRQGEQSSGFFLLLRGTCQVVDQSKAKERRYPDLREGDVFGEISLLLGKPATATVRAASECVVLRLGFPAFRARVLSNEQVRELMTKLTVERLRRTAALLREVAPGGADYRV